MRKFTFISTLTAFTLSLTAPSLVQAETVEGTIQRIDEGKNILRLSDGNSYTLPGEFDYSLLGEGMKVLIFYDIAGDVRYISDIEPEGMELPLETEE